MAECVRSFFVMGCGGWSAKQREKNLIFVIDTPGLEDSFACVGLERWKVDVELGGNQ